MLTCKLWRFYCIRIVGDRRRPWKLLMVGGDTTEQSRKSEQFENSFQGIEKLSLPLSIRPFWNPLFGHSSATFYRHLQAESKNALADLLMMAPLWSCQPSVQQSAGPICLLRLLLMVKRTLTGGSSRSFQNGNEITEGASFTFPQQ